MKILVLAQLNSPHTQRWCNWLMEHNVDVFPIGVTDPDAIRRQIILFKPDIIHAFFVPIWGFAAHAVNFHPYVITAIGSDLLQLDRYDKELTSTVLKDVDAFVGLSQELMEIGISLGASAKKSSVIHLGVDTELFKPKYSPLHNKWHTTPNTKVILSCRHMMELYNHRTIIEALPRVIDRFGDVNLVHVDPHGDPDYFNEIADLIDKLKMTEYVHSNAALPHYQMPYAYNACDVAIGIPTTDGLAVTMLEAAACQVPYVATDTPTNRHFLPPELLVDPKNPKEVTKALILAINKRFSTAILDKNRWMVQSYYEQDRVMEFALDMYRSLL